MPLVRSRGLPRNTSHRASASSGSAPQDRIGVLMGISPSKFLILLKTLIERQRLLPVRQIPPPELLLNRATIGSTAFCLLVLCLLECLKERRAGKTLGLAFGIKLYRLGEAICSDVVAPGFAGTRTTDNNELSARGLAVNVPHRLGRALDTTGADTANERCLLHVSPYCAMPVRHARFGISPELTNIPSY